MQLLDKCKALLKYVEAYPKAQQDTEYLEDLYIGGGICDSVVVHPTEHTPLNACFRTWEHFNGNVGYPIPGDAIGYYIYEQQPFDTTHEYCRLRVDLLKHIITCLEAEECETY